MRLLAILCDGQATDAEQERLEKILSSSPKARRIYLQYVDVHSRLLMHPGVAKGRKMPPREAWAWAALEEAAGMERRAAAWNAFRRRQWTWQRITAYVGVAAATLAATLLLQLILRGPQSGPLAVTPVAGPPEPPQYVATLAQAVGAEWDQLHPNLAEGSRLLPGELKLQQGLARIHFDSGVDLLVQAPAELRLESSKAAWLNEGKVVFQGEAAASPFVIRTPLSILIDTGTEYGVEVGAGRDELHVFSGEVQREGVDRKKGSTPELVAGGQARWYASAKKPGETMQLAPQRFVRQMPSASPALPDPSAGLLAYEGFAYRNVTDLKDRLGVGGTGWSSPWELGVVWPPPSPKRKWSLNVEATLARPDAPAASVGGAFDYAGTMKYVRRLQTPVKLDADGVYYLSYLFRREGPSRDRDNRVGVQLRLDEELKRERRGKGDLRKRLDLGVGRANELYTHLERNGKRMPLPLSYNEPYLLVAKIVASREHPDQVFVRVYGVEEAITGEEPETWSIVGPPVASDLTFDWLEMDINSWRRQTLDEIRLGSTWASVTAPYVVTTPTTLPPQP